MFDCNFHCGRFDVLASGSSSLDTGHIVTSILPHRFLLILSFLFLIVAVARSPFFCFSCIVITFFFLTTRGRDDRTCNTDTIFLVGVLFFCSLNYSNSLGKLTFLEISQDLTTSSILFYRSLHVHLGPREARVYDKAIFTRRLNSLCSSFFPSFSYSSFSNILEPLTSGGLGFAATSCNFHFSDILILIKNCS